MCTVTMSKALENTDYGIEINDVSISRIRYADDSIIVAYPDVGL